MDPKEAGANELTPLQIKFMEALLDGNTLIGACRIAGISKSTGGRWFRESQAFRTAYADAKLALHHSTIQGVIESQQTVKDTLNDLMSPNEPAGVRLAAAKQMQEVWMRLVNQDAGEVAENWPPALLGV